MSDPKVNDIVVTAMGAISPVGGNAEQTCAAIHANIAAIKEHAYYTCIAKDQYDDELSLNASSVPFIDPYLDGAERLLQLAIPALLELFGNTLLDKQNTDNAGLLLALPQSDESTNDWQLQRTFIPQLCHRLELANFKTSNINQEGHTGMFSLIGDAIEQLQSGQLDYCIVGGVDSWLFEKRLVLLDKTWRLKSGRNIDGFIPGEAAVMLLLETASHASTANRPILSQISGLGGGTEIENIDSDKNSSGEGLAEAITNTLQYSSVDQHFESVYCDLNGESYRGFEWGLMQARLGTRFENIKQLIHPAENCGDVGAAIGGLLIASASTAFQHGYNKSGHALLWTASDSGQRMALHLQAAKTQTS